MKMPWETSGDVAIVNDDDDAWLKSLGQNYAEKKAGGSADPAAATAAAEKAGGIKPSAPQDEPTKAGLSLSTPEAPPQPLAGNDLQQLSKAKTTDRMFMTGAPEAEGHTIKKRGELAGYAGIANFVSDVIKYAASAGAGGAAAGMAGGAGAGAGAAAGGAAAGGAAAGGAAAGGAAAGGAAAGGAGSAGFTSAATASDIASAQSLAGSGSSSFSGDFMNGVMGREGSGGYGQMLGQKTRDAALNQLGGGGGGGAPADTAGIESERQAAQKGGPMGAGSAVKAGTAYLKDRKMQALGLKDPSQYLSGGYDLWA